MIRTTESTGKGKAAKGGFCCFYGLPTRNKKVEIVINSPAKGFVGICFADIVDCFVLTFKRFRVSFFFIVDRVS